MKIDLHLGAHFCAAKRFQSYVWANRVALARRGVTCWTPKRTRDGLLSGLLREPERITLRDEHRAVRSTGRLRVEFERLARDGQHSLLISEESMIGTAEGNIAAQRLYPLMDERLRRFLPAFEGMDLHIGLCIRSYEGYWASVLAGRMATGMPRPTVDVLDRLTTQPRRWRLVVRDIATIFPKAKFTVWPFEAFADRPGAVLDLFAVGASQGLNAAAQPMCSSLMPFNQDQSAVLRAEYRRDIAWLKAGAEGLATYADGRQTPAVPFDRGLNTTHGAAGAAREARGHDDGIEKGLGRPRTG